MEWTGAALNRVDRDKFFAKFKDAEAVQYFYEPFLEAFDPDLRKQLGVWYTPPEIVKYMVSRARPADCRVARLGVAGARRHDQETHSAHEADRDASVLGGGALDGPLLEVTARWGIAGKGGVTMPSTGKLAARAFTEAEQAALGDAAALLGPDTLDVYLNEKAYWKCVPRAVWEYHLGGYQVLKKWLSYREKALLGRGLKIEEVRHVRDTARRIAALILLRPQLDANYAATVAAQYVWKPANKASTGESA